MTRRPKVAGAAPVRDPIAVQAPDPESMADVLKDIPEFFEVRERDAC